MRHIALASSGERRRTIHVLVHPSWPWETKSDMIARHRSPVLRRCAQVLARIEAETDELAIVGPFSSRAGYLPDPVADILGNLERRAKLVAGGTDSFALRRAGESIARWHPGANLVICGFWRDLCCSEVAYGAEDSEAQVTVAHNRSLSRCCPPESVLKSW